MSRFNSEAYDKLFPREQQKEVVESAVETFKPSEKKDEVIEEKAVESERVIDPLLDEPIDTEMKGGDVEVEGVEKAD